jgi:anaerobic dimethyl sulfoxide reductase subunit C
VETREWALITFTILAQMCVGAFLALGIVHFFVRRRSGAEQADQLADRALLAIWPVLGLGLLASLLHLGNPLNGYRAVTNLGSSWLSREIFCGVLFAVLGFAFALMQWRKIGSFTLRTVVAWIAALVGLALVFAMSNAYMVPARPAWNIITTPLSFFTTTGLLGVLALGAAFVANYAYVQRTNPGCASEQCALLRDILRWFALASIVLLGLEFIILPLTLALWSLGPAVASTQMLVGEFGIVFGLRLALVFLGAGVLAIFVYQAAQKVGQEKIMGNLAYAAFLLVFVAEVLGRFLFYATTVKIGLQ